MASTLTITKQSGVLFLSVDSLPARSFFGATGNYQFSSDGVSVLITLGNYQINVPWSGLRVGTSTPPTASAAATLLNAIFGT